MGAREPCPAVSERAAGLAGCSSHKEFEDDQPNIAGKENPLFPHLFNSLLLPDADRGLQTVCTSLELGTELSRRSCRAEHSTTQLRPPLGLDALRQRCNFPALKPPSFLHAWASSAVYLPVNMARAPSMEMGGSSFPTAGWPAALSSSQARGVASAAHPSHNSHFQACFLQTWPRRSPCVKAEEQKADDELGNPPVRCRAARRSRTQLRYQTSPCSAKRRRRSTSQHFSPKHTAA